MALISEVQNTLSYKRIYSTDNLLAEVDKAFVRILKQRGLIQFKDFDESLNPDATINDIDRDKLDMFIGIARAKRGFPLRVGAPIEKILAHLNMINGEQLTNSALLAFGRKPQKFFPSAIVKCAHFHGLHVAKPIPDHRVIRGDVFEQVDQAVDFVMAKLSMSVGLRETSAQAPLAYEIPRPVVTEAIVNAVAHRDYNSRGSVQVMLFKNRLDVSNPGELTSELSIAKLKVDHASYPTNHLLAEPLYQAGYIERYGTDTGEIFRLSAEAGLLEPGFALEEVFKLTIWRPAAISTRKRETATFGDIGEEVNELIKRLILVLNNAMTRTEIMHYLDLRHLPNFRDNYLLPALDTGCIEMTLPDTPRSSKQRYRLTKKGKSLQALTE